MRAPRLRIALLAPLVSPIREPYLGGAQALLRDLAVTLARRGADVTLYAARGSDAPLPGVRLREIAVDAANVRPANFHERVRTPSPEADDAMEAAFRAAYATIATHADEHDLIHAHAYDAPAFTLGAAQPLPIAHTLHMPDLHDTIGDLLSSYAPLSGARAQGQPWLVTVSSWCAQTYASTCRIDAVIPNGVDVDAIPYGAHPSEPRYLLFAGRLTPEKGVTDAIAIARASARPLRIVGGVYDRAYFESKIQPALSQYSHDIVYMGALRHERVWSLMAGAYAVLVPSQWDEPFGLVACEAQAAGAPVIAYARGGLRDIIADNETGALIAPDSVEDAAAAVQRMETIARRACRARVASRFSLDRMAEAHESLYARMLGR